MRLMVICSALTAMWLIVVRSESIDAVGGSSFCDNYDAVVPALFCANRVAIIRILSDCWASKHFRAQYPYMSSW
jgi:hypothetical protein